MKKPVLKKLAQSALILTFSVQAYAEVEFKDILKALTNNQEHVVSTVPDIDKLTTVSTLSEAAEIAKKRSYIDINSQVSKMSELSEKQILDLVKRKQTTIVIVPGLLGEFIETRAFEDLFSKETSYKNQWAEISRNSGVTDQRLNLEKFAYENISISELIDAASIDDEKGNPILKVILLKTKIGSLESVGENESRAEIFNRRLQKYINLTEDKSIVLLGYSRGTPLALEMLTQAQKNNLSYLSKVKAVVSHAGVIFGSSLADLTEDLSTSSGKLFAAAKVFAAKLKNSKTLLDRPIVAFENSSAFAEFLTAFALNTKTNPQSLLENARNGDFNTVAALIAQFYVQLGLKNPTDFNGHVDRVKYFITEIMKSVDTLKTKNTIAWWKTHTLPKNIKYYSISAAMVDPKKSSLEKSIYDLKIGYNDTLDDSSLLDNMRTYEASTGISLNDSQVALHQSTFLNGVIASLNPENSGLETKSLGLLETHHWGVSLRTVNKMKDGRNNPFPREKIMMSLGAYLNQ